MHGVDLVFSGHDHVYERTVPIRGVTYVVSGGGGKRLYRAGKGELTSSLKFAHHAVLVRVDGGGLLLEAGEAAHAARVKHLVPTHIRSSRFVAPDALVAEAEAAIEGPVDAANDLDTFAF